MKNRSKLTIFTAILCVLGCFGLGERSLAAPDPVIPFASNTSDGANANVFDAGAFNSSFGWFTQFLASSTGLANTAVGAGALDINQASSNSAVGAGALFLNQTATFNTSVGTFALAFNDSNSPPNGTANSNTAVGTQALFLNVDAPNNTALGARALFNNGPVADSGATAFDNTAVGTAALFFNAFGSDNTAVGFNALLNNTLSQQTAVGSGALASNVAAPETVAVGYNASNVLGSAGNVNGYSVAVGYQALLLDNGGQNTGVGDNVMNAVTTGTLNTAIGDKAGLNIVTGTNNVSIGDFTGIFAADESNTIRILDPSSGTPATDCFIGGIFGNLTPGSAVYIDASGHLSTTASSRRFKDDIKPMDKASEAILALKPVTFHFKGDAKKLQCFGLIAEDVVEVNPDLVIRDEKGQVANVRYEQINAMLLNEFLKEHKKVEEQQASISQLKSEMQTMVAQLKEQAAQIQKVSAQLEMSKPAPQVVTNKP